MKRRKFLAGTSTAVAVSLTGCLGSVFGPSQAEQELIDYYQEAYRIHQRGLRYLNDGFSAYRNNKPSATVSYNESSPVITQFENAGSAYSEAKSNYGLNQVELIAEVFGPDGPPADKQARAALVKGELAAGDIVTNLRFPVQYSRMMIEEKMRNHQNGMYEMPTVEEFEDAL